MGFEDYQVYLGHPALNSSGISSVTRDKVAKDLVNNWEQIHFDKGSFEQQEYPHWSDRTYLCFETPEHLFEILITGNENSQIGVSMRFALCNPPSIDNDFCRVVNWLMEKYKFEVSVCRDLDPKSPDQLHDTRQPAVFERLYLQSIDYNRYLWQQDTGTMGTWKFRPEEAIYELYLKPRSLI